MKTTGEDSFKALENAAGEEFYADITREDLYNSDMELFR